MDIFIINNEDNKETYKYLAVLQEIYDSSCEEYKVVRCVNRIDTIQKVLYYGTLDTTRYIFSIGGNPTLNSVINGMFLSKKPLVVIPCGNNDLYNSIVSFNKDIMIDLGRVNDEYFLGSVSVGLDALVSQKINSMPINKNASYVRELLRLCVNYSGLNIDLETNLEKVIKKINLLSIYNGAYFGNTKVIPSASLTDGKLNLMMADNTSRLRLFYNFLKFWLNDYQNSGDITCSEIEKAFITFDHPIIYTYDGISKCDCELNVCIEPKKVLVKRELNPKIDRLCNDKNCK